MERYIEEPLSEAEEKLIKYMDAAGMEEEEVEVILGQLYVYGITEKVLQTLEKEHQPYSEALILRVIKDTIVPLIRQ